MEKIALHTQLLTFLWLWAAGLGRGGRGPGRPEATCHHRVSVGKGGLNAAVRKFRAGCTTQLTTGDQTPAGCCQGLTFPEETLEVPEVVALGPMSGAGAGLSPGATQEHPQPSVQVAWGTLALPPVPGMGCRQPGNLGAVEAAVWGPLLTLPGDWPHWCLVSSVVGSGQQRPGVG